MTGRAERTRVAVLVGVGTIAFIGLLLFARRPVFLDRQREYQAAFQNVAGLNVGDEVRYGGVRVGSVTSLEIDSAPPSTIRVRLRVRRSTPVRADTRARRVEEVPAAADKLLRRAPSSPWRPSRESGSIR